MNLWNKLVIGTKFLFGGFEAATDYALKLLLNALNGLISGGNVAAKVQKIWNIASTVMEYLGKYEDYCPTPWVDDFKKLKTVIQSLIDAFEDGKVTSEEAERTIALVKDAIAEWMK